MLLVHSPSSKTHFLSSRTSKKESSTIANKSAYSGYLNWWDGNNATQGKEAFCKNFPTAPTAGL